MPSATSALPPPAREYGRGKFIALLLVVVNEAISVSMLYPYVGLLIVHLDPGMARKDAGTLSGLIVGSFNIAQAIFAQRWGRLSDTYGRRPMMVLGLIGSAVFSTLFGLSNSVWQLLVFRFLYGAANGNAPLSKTMTAEMTTSSTDAYGWAMMSAGWSIGSTIGPTFGGVLYDPSSHWPSVFAGTIFESKPALLPGLFGAAYSIFAIGVVRFVLPESNPKARMPLWVARLLGDERAVARSADAPTVVVGADADDSELAPIRSTATTEESDGGEEDQPLSASFDRRNAASAASPKKDEYGIRDMVLAPTMRRVLFMYVMLAWANTAFNETFPLLAITPVRQGGLGLDATEIGFAFTIFAFCNMLSTACFPRVVGATGRLNLIRYGLWILGVSMAAHAALPAFDWGCSATKIVAWSSVLSFPRVWVANFCFSISTMGIAASAPRDHLGAATGLSHSCGNVARALLPPVATWLFAWSVRFSTGGDAPTRHDHLVPAAPPHFTVAAGATGGSLFAMNATMANATDAVGLSGNHTANAGDAVCGGDPQSFLGPMFPLNRWFCFLILAGAVIVSSVATNGMREAQFVRPPTPSAQQQEAPSGAQADDREESVPARDDDAGAAVVIRASPEAETEPSPEPSRPN